MTRSNRRRLALLPFAIFAIALAPLALIDPRDALRATYLGAYAGLHLCLGCAALLFIGDLTSAKWAGALEPVLDRGRRLIYLALPFALILPLLAMGSLYPWTQNEAEFAWPISKEAYLSPGPFALRLLLYAIAFAAVAFMAGRSAANLRARSKGAAVTSRRASAGGLVLHAFTNLLFQVDAAMSIDPEWFSTGFPLIMMASQALAAYCLCLFCHLAPERNAQVAPQFGNLLLATLLFWLYVAFSQFLIIWMGNLAEDIIYYLQRSSPLWKGIAVFLFVFSFILPLLLLIQTKVKRSARSLGWIAMLLALGQMLYLFWAIVPSWEGLGPGGTVLGALALLGFGGLWLHRALAEPGKEARHGD